MKNAQLSSHSKSKKKSNISNRPQKYNKREKFVSLSNINFCKNSTYSLNKENISCSYNSQVKQISTNSSSNSLQKNLNKKKENKDSNLNRKSLINKCQLKFSSLYNNYLSQSINNSNLKSNISNVNKIRVNKNVKKVLSPINSTKSNYNKRNKKNKSNKNNNNNKFLSKTNRNQYLNSKNILQYANFKDINYIKYININVDIDKIKYIQCWWRYIFNIIFLQKNIRTFLVKIKTKQKLKNYNFIIAIIKIFFNSFINNIQISYLRKIFSKWKEIIYKRIILKRLLTEKEKKLFSINNSFHNSLIIDNYNYNNKNNNNRTMTFGNVKNMPNIPINNSGIFQEKITSPFQREVRETGPMNVKINIKKTKNFACNLYNSREKNNTLNKSLSNNNNNSMKKSTLNDSKLTNSNKRAKSNNKVMSRVDNKSFNLDEKTQTITNNLYKNIKEYYNINEININPTVSTINFYQNRLYKNISKKIKNSANNFKNNNMNINNNNAKIKKKTLISNVKNNKRTNFNDFYKNNKIDNNWIAYQNTFGNLKTNITSINFTKNINNKIHSTVISPASNSNRVTRRNKNRSLEFEDSDINSIKFLLKYKRTFLHWKSLIFKNKIIKKLRLIQKIKHIIFVYKSIYIKIFFSKMIQKMYKNTFYQNKINFNYIVLNQYYDKLKEISKKKKVINEMNYKYNKKIMISKKERNKSYKKKTNEKKNNSMNSNGQTNPEGLYYATQFNQKFNKLLNDRKGVKNNNIIIINNNINNNCQQLINNNIKQNKSSNLNFSNNYYKKTGNNNSMIDIQPTDTSLNCTADINNQSDKSSNSILIHNHINGNQKKNINDKKNISKTNRTYYLNKMIKILINNRNKKILGKYLNKWKIRIVMKKCSLSKNNIIDEKIIYFPKSPNSNNNIKSHIRSNNYLDNQNNYIYNYTNNCNYTYDNNVSTHNKSNSKIYINNNDLMMQTMLTENNIKNTKNMYGNNPSLLRNKIFTPSNKYSFYTQYPNENTNNINYIKPPRETEPKIVYHKKIFPSYASKNMKPNNNTIVIDYNYNRDNNIGHNHKLSMNMNMNGITYGNNIISNFYSSNNFFNRRSNYHLENMNNILPEEKYGFKKNNKIEEREISFSPSLNRKNQSFKNVIKDNYQNINNNNIYINVVENFRSDFQNQNMNSLNDLSRLNYGNSFQPMNRSATEEDNLNKLMCHSHSQGFTKTIQSLFGH